MKKIIILLHGEKLTETPFTSQAIIKKMAFKVSMQDI